MPSSSVTASTPPAAKRLGDEAELEEHQKDTKRARLESPSGPESPGSPSRKNRLGTAMITNHADHTPNRRVKMTLCLLTDIVLYFLLFLQLVIGLKSMLNWPVA
jgi:hypothetical protein